MVPFAQFRQADVLRRRKIADGLADGHGLSRQPRREPKIRRALADARQGELQLRRQGAGGGIDQAPLWAQGKSAGEQCGRLRVGTGHRQLRQAQSLGCPPEVEGEEAGHGFLKVPQAGLAMGWIGHRRQLLFGGLQA